MRKHDLKGTKFIMVLNPKIEKDLRRRAERAGINLQELIRTLVIPDWLFGPPVVSNRVIQRLRDRGLIPNNGEKKPD